MGGVGWVVTGYVSCFRGLSCMFFCFKPAGLATEFMNKHEASVYYKKGLSYDAIVPDFHRSRYCTLGHFRRSHAIYFQLLHYMIWIF